MKYPKITALVPEKEHFDSSVIGEGVWMTVGHVDSIESALEVQQTSIDEAVAIVQSALTETETTLAATKELLTASETLVAERDTTVSTQAARIQELEAKVVELGGKPSGTRSTITAPIDTPPAAPVSTAIPFDSPEHPANKMADELTGSKMVRSI
jgi:uncharacterized membrane protein